MNASLRLLSAALVSSFVLPLSALAQEDVRETRSPVRITIGNDTYVAGEQVTVSEAVNGNINVAGGGVSVLGTVSGDVQAAGGDVHIGGGVRDNLRVVGGDVRISGRVNGTATVAGGRVLIEKDAVIGGGLLVTGGTVVIDGTVNGMLKAYGGEVTVNGVANGITDIRAESAAVNGNVAGNATVAAGSLNIGETARFGGNLDYWSVQGQRDLSASVQGTATYREDLRFEREKNGRHAAAGLFIGLSLFSLFSAAFVIGLLLFFTKNFFRDAAKDLQKQPWISLLTGFLYVVLTPIVAVVLLATLIGIPVAVAILLMYAVSLYFSTAVTSMVLARYVEIRYKKKWHPVSVFFVALGLFIVLKALWIIPFLGWLASMILIFMGLGSVLGVKYRILNKVR